MSYSSAEKVRGRKKMNLENYMGEYTRYKMTSKSSSSKEYFLDNKILLNNRRCSKTTNRREDLFLCHII